MDKNKLAVKEERVAKFNDFNDIGDMMGFAETLIKSKMLPPAYNTPEKVVAAVTQGKELGFDPMTSLSNLHVIQGKPTLSVHAIAALLARAGIVWKIVKDCESIEKDGKVVDKITTIRFLKKWHGETIENDISFTWKEAQAQGLTVKDNWKRMPQIMLRNRALAIGARFVAPDALLGIYETTEMAEVMKVEHTVDAEGAVVIN